MRRRKWVTPLISGERLRLSREARVVSVRELAEFFKKSGATETRIQAIEAMPKVPREIESRYVSALMTAVFFRDRLCIVVHSCPKLSQSDDFENLKTDQASGR